jgi:starvation-inducible DNA-binding protein
MSDVVRMYKMAHLSHWNVTGPNFASMHEFFGDLYTDVYESIDPIAEKHAKD